MTSVLDKKRAVLLALVVALAATFAVLVGAGKAHAAWPCRDQPPPQDTTVNINNDTYAGVDVYNTGSTSGAHGFWVCVAPTGGEPNQKVVLVTVEDPGTNPAPGATVNVGACGLTGLSPSPHPWMAPCGANYTLAPTGAEVGTPATSLTTSGSRPSGSVGTGTGTCVYANSPSGTCPSGVKVAGITVNEADLIPSVTPSTPTPPCTGINNTCIPLGATVRIFQDTSNPTATVETAATPATNVEVAPSGTCVQVNATC